jgi:hypothetical protein
MENMIKYLSLMVLVFFVESCYTIILKPKPSPATLKPFKCQTVAAFNVLEFKLNYDLIGTWESDQIWMDGGEEIKRLEFSADGKIKYFPHFEEANSTYSEGEFRTISDTLIVCFEDQDVLEKFRFNVNLKSLLLSSFGETKDVHYSINENSWYRITE